MEGSRIRAHWHAVCKRSGHIWRVYLAASALLTLTGCDRGLDVALTRQIEAQKLAADMRVQLHRSAEAVQRAVMADADEVSASFVRESQEATAALEDDRRSIDPILASIGSDKEQQLVQEFGEAFRRVQDLDRDLLALAVENTNVKAQRLSFGPAREAADALREHLTQATRAAPGPKAVRAELLAARVQLAVREIQALEAPHIAEPDDAAMTELERQMAEAEAVGRASLAELQQLLGAAADDELGAGREEFDRFLRAHREILELSRRNSDVRSLVIALGDKRTLTAAADAALIALQAELAKHGSEATR
jgi:hypothetical protein